MSVASVPHPVGQALCWMLEFSKKSDTGPASRYIFWQQTVRREKPKISRAPYPCWEAAEGKTCRRNKFKMGWHLWLNSSDFREGNGTPLQYSCLENPMDGGTWKAAVHGVAEGRTQLSDFTFKHWRRKWQPTPVFLPGESQGRGSLVGCVYGVAQSQTWLKRLSSSSSSSDLEKYVT